MKYKYILLLNILSLQFFSAFSQVKGYVTDNKGSSIPYVNVILQNETDSAFIEGTITNGKGFFRFEAIPSASAVIRFSSIGYITQTVPVSRWTGKVILQDEVNQLDEVTVKSSRPVYKMKGTGLVVNVQNSIMKDLGSANDIIERLPGIKGNDGSFQVFGKGTAVIYINSRKVEDTAELSRLNAADIETIEIIRNPGVEYDADTKAVIKIRLKRNENEGISGTVTLKGNQGRRFSDSEYVQLAYNASHINTFLSFGNYSTRIQTDQRNENITVAQAHTWDMHTDMMDWDNRYYTQNLAGGLSYISNKNHVMGGSVSYTDNRNNYGGISQTEMERDNRHYEDLRLNSNTKDSYRQWIGNIYYEGKLDNWNISFNGDYVRRTSDGTEENREEGNLTPMHVVCSFSEATYDIYAGRLKLDYRMNSGMSLSFGLDGSQVEENKGNRETDNGTIGARSAIWSEETKYATFATCTWNYRKMSVQIGGRYERVEMNYQDRENDKKLVNRTYGRFYPSVSISLPAGQSEMVLVYASKVKRPSFYQLRNSTEYSNRYSSAQGNPYLQPQYTSDLSYSLQYKDLQFSIGYLYVEDYAGTQVIIEATDPLKRISTPVNIPHYHALQGGLSYHPSVGYWKPQASLDIMRTFLDLYNSNGTKIKHILPCWIFSVVNSFQFPNQWNAFADIYYTADGYLREYRIRPYAYVNVGISKHLFKNSLMVSLSVYDLFRSCKERDIRYSPYDIFERWRYRDSQQVRLTMKYDLYKNKKKYQGKNVANDEINRL